MAQTGSITATDRIKLQKLYNERGPAAFGSINNLTKASGISREKVTEFLQSKDLYEVQRNQTKISPAKCACSLY